MTGKWSEDWVEWVAYAFLVAMIIGMYVTHFFFDHEVIPWW